MTRSSHRQIIAELNTQRELSAKVQEGARYEKDDDGHVRCVFDGRSARE